MGEIISDKELRQRLLVFNTVVPPVTSSTRKLLLKKLAELESSKTNKNAASKSMPPPKPKAPTNVTNESIMISSSVDGIRQSQHIIHSTESPRKSTRRRQISQILDALDTSDSEVDTATLGRSILPANPKIASSSPKSNETSLMNVSNWKNRDDANDDQTSYSSPEKAKPFNKQSEIQSKNLISELRDFRGNKIPTESVTRKLRKSSQIESMSHAEQAIQRWKEKNKEAALNTSISNSSSPISKLSSQNSRRNFQFASNGRNLRNRFTFNTQYILLLFVGFFAIIFGLYFISIQPSTVILPPGILNSLCAKKSLQGSDCDTEQAKVQRLYNLLVSQVQDKYIKSQCDKLDLKPTVDAQSAFEYISTHETIPSREIEELIELFKSISKTYSDSPIGFDTSFKINMQPNLPIMCAAKHIFSNMFYLVIWIGIVLLSVVGLYFVICYITAKSEKHKQEVNYLIEMTIDLLKEKAQNQQNESYIPIIHIRDHLIKPNERQEKSKIWAEVVQYFTESESSVRSEIQEIDGEDFKVWRWVQPMSPGI